MPAVARRDYYEVLGISRGASAPEVRSAYRRLARRYSPDVNVWDGARSTLVCLAMLESARTGSPVSIDLEQSLRGEVAGPSRL